MKETLDPEAVIIEHLATMIKQKFDSHIVHQIASFIVPVVTICTNLLEGYFNQT